ncbi:signal peptidase I [Bacillus mobilis]|uniref:signal peptidase I n=1 Tax=Bacillus mobilis TaxID=2026190 RepID=UPI0036366080
MRRLKFAVGLVSLTVVSALAGLVLAATVLPLVMGWDRVVLTSGSMMPRIAPGDIVLVAPVEHPIKPGTVITFKNPNKPGSLITHRTLDIRPDGSYRTKGDANGPPDVSPVRHDAVIGKGLLLVPAIGLPAVWIQNGQPMLAAAAVFVVILLGFLSRYGLLKKHDPWHVPEKDEPLDGPDDQNGPKGPSSRGVRKWAVPVGIVVAVSLAAAGVWLAPKPTRAAFAASSVNHQNLISTAAAAANIFYLKTNAPNDSPGPSTTTPLELTSTAPTLTTLYNYDTAHDTDPGLLIAKGIGQGLDAPLGASLQSWMMPRATTVISGNAKARLWTAMKGFSPTKTGSLTVGLYICNPGSNNCTAAGTPVTITSQGSWSGGSTTWVPTDIDLGTINLPSNRVLQIRVAVGSASSDAMMLAYDTTTYPARVTVG